MKICRRPIPSLFPPSSSANHGVDFQWVASTQDRRAATFRPSSDPAGGFPSEEKVRLQWGVIGGHMRLVSSSDVTTQRLKFTPGSRIFSSFISPPCHISFDVFLLPRRPDRLRPDSHHSEHRNHRENFPLYFFPLKPSPIRDFHLPPRSARFSWCAMQQCIVIQFI